eukprot:scaffold1669_cov129-Cylindrotheca_fusiformis.AAC.35
MSTIPPITLFWLYQLDFIVAMEDLSASGPFSHVRKCLNSGGDKLSRTYQHVVLSPFLETDSSDQEGLVDGAKFSILRLVVAFVMSPIWFLLGAATLGYFWPPQVTEMIFHRHPPKGSAKAYDILNAWDGASDYNYNRNNEEAANMASEIQNLAWKLQHMETKSSGLETKIDLLIGLLNKK